MESGDGSEGTFQEVLDLVEELRARCPWDAAQTPTTLIPYFLEEAYEVVEAVEDADDDALEAELGDLLLHAAFQVVLAEERRAFDRRSVVRRVVEKMRRRHPHIYGTGEAEDWEALKAEEREGPTLGDLPERLDPLLRAHRIQERVSGVGFDWSDASGAWEKVAEELEEVGELLEDGGPPPDPHGPASPGPDGADPGEPSPELVEELGDLLFAVVNLTRLSGIHAVEALRAANAKFERRFDALERRAEERGIDLTRADLETLDAIWEELKEGL